LSSSALHIRSDSLKSPFYLGRSCCCCPHSVSHVGLVNWRQGHTSRRHGRPNRHSDFSKCSVLRAAGTRLIEARLLGDAALSTRLGLHASGSGRKSPRKSTGYLPMSFSGESLASMAQSLYCGKWPTPNMSATVPSSKCSDKRLTCNLALLATIGRSIHAGIHVSAFHHERVEREQWSDVHDRLVAPKSTQSD
jgi:hypothetical protein